MERGPGGTIVLSTPDVFWAKVDKTGQCWLWTACKNRAGYGQIRYRNEKWLAHRLSYVMLVGPIPEGQVIDHLCRVPACVRPDHLEPVTQRVNNERGNSVTTANARKTHCPRGHPYDEVNTYWNGHGRHCRICLKAKNDRRYRRTA